MLQNLALALAQGGNHGTAEGKLLGAIEELQKLDGVSVESGGGAHKVRVVGQLTYRSWDAVACFIAFWVLASLRYAYPISRRMVVPPHRLADDAPSPTYASFGCGLVSWSYGGTMQATLVNLHKYLAIARRARGDMPGAKEALATVESVGGSEGREDVEGLNRLLAHNRIATD